MRESEPILAKPDPHGHGTVMSHPSFGQISVFRTSGGEQALYGSDFLHSRYISIEIHHSELHRSLSSDWPFQRDEIVRVMMSEAQWATFVSSLNQGSGVQCTIDHLTGVGLVPGFELPDRSAQFKGEANERIGRVTAELRELLGKLEAGTSGLSKTKAADLAAHVNHALTEIGSNLQFVSDQFGEHMEKTVEKAKAEVHGYIQGEINRAGLTALGAGQPPLVQLSEGPK